MFFSPKNSQSLKESDVKLASLKTQNPRQRNGDLIVVSRDNLRASRVDHSIARTLLEALENWKETKPALEKISEGLNGGSQKGFALDPHDCVAPLVNAPGFYDGSAFLSHVYRARKARGDEMPATAKKIPLMYQGVSDQLLGAHDPIDLMDNAFGGDFEGEFGVITTDVPKGIQASDAHSHVALVIMLNDITFREIVKTEIEFKFGFLQSKPNSSFAPFAVTPDELELGNSWVDGRLNLDLNVQFNGKSFGHPNGKEMHFSFYELVAHAARTRPLSAGSIIGSGTVSNEDKDRGFACLTEKRFQEILDGGKPTTPWLKHGDRVIMDTICEGESLFGVIDQVSKN
jgi:fumarylacetoacetate (FAA) hydrolase